MVRLMWPFRRLGRHLATILSFAELRAVIDHFPKLLLLALPLTSNKVVLRIKPRTIHTGDLWTLRGETAFV